MIKWNAEWKALTDGLADEQRSVGPSSDPRVILVLAPDEPPEWTCDACGWLCDADVVTVYDEGERPPLVLCPNCGEDVERQEEVRRRTCAAPRG